MTTFFSSQLIDIYMSLFAYNKTEMDTCKRHGGQTVLNINGQGGGYRFNDRDGLRA